MLYLLLPCSLSCNLFTLPFQIVMLQRFAALKKADLSALMRNLLSPGIAS